MANNPTGWIGLVLAGGASSRMGTDKALLELRGRTLLDRAIAVLEAAGAERVIVSGDRPGYDAVPDLKPGLGPLGGLASVLAARGELLRGRLLLALPVDVPALDARAVQTLLHAARNASGAVFSNHPLPAAIWVTPAFEPMLTATLEGPGSASAFRLGRCLKVREIAPDGADLRNVNTPESWAALQGEFA